MCELQVRLDSLEQSLELSFPQQLKEMDEAFSEMQATSFDCRRCCNCKFCSYVLNMIHYAYCTCHRHSWRPYTCFCASFRSCVRPATPCCRGHLKNFGPSLLLLCRTPLLSGRLESLQCDLYSQKKIRFPRSCDANAHSFMESFNVFHAAQFFHACALQVQVKPWIMFSHVCIF